MTQLTKEQTEDLDRKYTKAFKPIWMSFIVLLALLVPNLFLTQYIASQNINSIGIYFIGLAVLMIAFATICAFSGIKANKYLYYHCPKCEGNYDYDNKGKVNHSKEECFAEQRRLWEGATQTHK
jgi:hypothetical protein